MASPSALSTPPWRARFAGQPIKGLTTAASVWLTAAIGVAAGMGRETTAVVSAVFAFVILSLLRRKDKE